MGGEERGGEIEGGILATLRAHVDRNYLPVTIAALYGLGKQCACTPFNENQL